MYKMPRRIDLLAGKERFAIANKQGEIIQKFFWKDTALNMMRYYELYPGELEVIELE